MKNLLKILFLALILVTIGCDSSKKQNRINVGMSAQYPLFVYIENDKIVGFEVELMDLVLKKMKLEGRYTDIQFNSVMPSLSSKWIEIGLGAITITSDREKNFDFSIPYYFDGIGVNFLRDFPVSSREDVLKLNNKKIGVQIGTTQEIWVKENLKNNTIINMDSNTQLIEAVKERHLDIIVIDESQAKVFSKVNSNLTHLVIEKAKNGYGMMFRKDSSLVNPVNQALRELEKEGTLKELKDKWFGEE